MQRESSSEAAGLEFSDDLPPPYSECSQKHRYEEPPPPYSACYVEFTYPKDAIPAVHFHNSRRQNTFRDVGAATCSRDPGDGDTSTNEVRAESPKALTDAC